MRGGELLSLKGGRTPDPVIRPLEQRKRQRLLKRKIALAGGGAPLLAVHSRLRTLLERLHVPDHAFAVVASQFEILGEFESIRWACIFT